MSYSRVCGRSGPAIWRSCCIRSYMPRRHRFIPRARTCRRRSKTSSRWRCRRIPSGAIRRDWISPPSSRVHQKLREQYSRMDSQEQFGLLRRLKFFHDFSHAEILEVMRASQWQDYASGEEIVKEGEMDDRFYVVVSGNCAVERHSESIGLLS